MLLGPLTVGGGGGKSEAPAAVVTWAPGATSCASFTAPAVGPATSSITSKVAATSVSAPPGLRFAFWKIGENGGVCQGCDDRHTLMTHGG